MGDIGDEVHDIAMEVDVLIAGAGPSGASLGSFLGSHGMQLECALQRKVG